jgi:hypothetical protein
MKLEAASSYERLVMIYQAARRYIPESSPRIHRRENLKPRITTVCKRVLGGVSRWEDNIKMGFRETVCVNVNRTELLQGRLQLKALVLAVLTLWVPL